MSAYALHRDGDCWPDTCPLCANECDRCGECWRDCDCTDDDTEETE